ncbi:SdpI family protein [Actinopolyspora sp. BKK1]|nr:MULTISPECIES: SdpI family protein [unclassified Actinopolyspora]NHD18952.1 SdpI family protein [Actinopolyspora sp. BKK2]NHE77375.1 SdpI family protein [Actinopolyspora sp. BKK1]
MLIIVCVAVILLGAAALTLGVRGLRGTLPRNRYAGVRTPDALRDEQTFRLANRVAAPPILAGGAVAVIAGGCAAALGTAATSWLVVGIGAVGAVALILTGGMLGARAAAAAPVESGCSVCAASSGSGQPAGAGSAGGGCAAAGLCSAGGGCAAALLGQQESSSPSPE